MWAVKHALLQHMLIHPRAMCSSPCGVGTGDTPILGVANRYAQPVGGWGKL